MNNVLVVSAHPDDETLGCGGTLLKHKANGDKIFWLIATRMKEENGFKKEIIARRKQEIKAVTSAYGFDKIFEFNLSTAKLDELSIADVISSVSEVFSEIRPSILYLPFKGDVHSDHRVIFNAAYSCTKHFRYPSVKKILMMEVISETEFSPSFNESAFVPNYFVDVSDFLDKKLDIMKIYKSELGTHPFPRSLENIKALATFRGATAGCKYAEAFVVLKEVQ